MNDPTERFFAWVSALLTAAWPSSGGDGASHTAYTPLAARSGEHGLPTLPEHQAPA